MDEAKQPLTPVHDVDDDPRDGDDEMEDRVSVGFVKEFAESGGHRGVGVPFSAGLNSSTWWQCACAPLSSPL